MKNYEVLLSSVDILTNKLIAKREELLSAAFASQAEPISNLENSAMVMNRLRRKMNQPGFFDEESLPAAVEIMNAITYNYGSRALSQLLDQKCSSLKIGFVDSISR